jgi:TetR/AcrR family transcriptional regulator, mexJK operon transcriptional repressor
MPELSHIDPRSGPTREEAEARDVRLLDIATRLFMERGFDGTSIDAVAEAARLSKPTVYARYHDGLVLLFTVRSGKAPTVLTLAATLKS